MVDDVELKACPHCGTTMHQHEYCFSHPKPATGDCILRHYSFDNSKREAWNTRTPSPVSVEEVASVIGDELGTRRYFARRAIDKSCYEVVRDTDPDGPIGDETFKIIATFPTNEEASEEAERLRLNAVAEAAIAALSARS